MSFNWRLLLAPERVLDYVVWHEVCHLRDRRSLAALLGAARVSAARAGASRPRWLRENGAGAGVVKVIRAALAGPPATVVPSRAMFRRFVLDRRRCRCRHRRGAARRRACGARASDAAAAAGRSLVTFSGTGGGGYRFHEPAAAALGRSAASPDTTYAETDSLQLELHASSCRPAGGTSDAPVDAGRQRAAERDRAARAVRRRGAASTSTCTQSLRRAVPANAGRPRLSRRDRRRLRAARHGRRARRAAPATRAGRAPVDGALAPNLVAGLRRLQASVSFPRALLMRTGDTRAPLHDGRLRPLQRRRAERQLQLGASCDTADCSAGSAAPAAGRPAAAASTRATAARSRSASSASQGASQRRRGRLAARAARRSCGARGR